MESKDLIKDLRSGKSVVYLKETYGQEFLEECGLGNLRRNHAWTNRVENINNVAKYLKKEGAVESLEYIVDTVRNVSWDQVRKIKNRSEVVNGIEKINQTYTRFLDKVYSQRNVEEIVEDNVVDLGVSRTEIEVNDWYQGMLSVGNPSNYLRDRLDELEDRGVNTRVGRNHAQNYLNELSERVEGNFVGSELRSLVNVLDKFSRKWKVDYNQIVLPKKKSNFGKLKLLGAVAITLASTGLAFAQDYSWNNVKELKVEEVSPVQMNFLLPENNGNVYFEWEDKRIESEKVISVDAEKNIGLGELKEKLVETSFFVIDENGKIVRNLPDGLKLNILRAEGNPIATDFSVCYEKWMFLVNGVYRCDVNPNDYFDGV